MPAIGVIIGASMIPLALQPFIHKLSELVMKEGRLLLYIKDEIRNLEGTFHEIQSVLEHVQNKQVECDSIRDWLRELVDIGYEARDVLDECYTVTAALVEERNASSSVSSLESFFRILSPSATVFEVPSPFQFRITHEIKNINARLDQMIKQKERFNQMIKQKEILELQESVGGGGAAKSTTPDSRPKSGQYFDLQKKNSFVGREEEKQKIIDKLRDVNNELVVVPIWGMGGIGKTTLALSIYHDDEVNKKYQNKIWLSVGDKKFNARDIMSEILGEHDANVSLNKLQEKLVEKFKGESKLLSVLRLPKKKFLIVLDDVWDLEGSEWKELWNPLTNVGSGGCIVITTRGKEVFTGTGIPEEEGIKPLSYNDCWLIFESRAFVDGKSDRRPDLKEVGQEIVKKLKGLPLAAEVVGCSLLNEQNVKKWKDFLKERQRWKLRNDKDDIMHALRWSYNRLPSSYLKQCFAYCSLFPKGHVFDEKVLTEMWMAHDFIQREREQRPEDIGEQYFEKLVNASLFQSVDGKYMMHDMIHDLALVVSDEEFTMVNDSPQNIAARHVSIASDLYNLDKYLKNLQSCRSKRILTIYTIDYLNLHNRKAEFGNGFLDKDIFRDIFQQLKSIRVLVLVSYAIKDIPDCISDLIHLRYLDLCKTGIKSLPDCLCKLHNLQTLEIPLNAVLPKNIVNMANLRYLRANLTIYNGFGKLTNLQELSRVSISKDMKIRELRNMPKELRGKLVIRGLENVTNLQDAGEGILKDKAHINQLELVREDERQFFTEEVLNVLSCPPELEYLIIDGYNGLNFPNWTMKILSNLNITRCDGLTLLKVDALVSLKYLSICGCSNLTTISFGATVEELFVYSCVKLNRMDSEIGSLKHLTVSGCPELMIEEASTSSSPSTSLSTLQTDNVVLFTKVFEYNNHVSLESMTIIDFGFEHFSESVVNKLPLLQFLCISSCKNLKSLSREFHNLTSLKKLEIRDCPQVQLLPTDLLPLSLKSLEVYHCPKLQEQCRKDSEHWQKFDHIPDIKVISKNTWDFPQGFTIADGESLTISLV